MNELDTKGELLAHLDKMTREMNGSSINQFTTARIASDCHVSRSLASQYLNELVRSGIVVKVGERPVLFFHRRGLERYLQARVDGCEFTSMRELLQRASIEEARDFDKAIGFELSYGTCIDHLKSAIQYPPHGLPALLVGEHGTGKQMMSKLTFEFGVNHGILPSGSRYVVVDCARFESSEAEVERVIFGGAGESGAVEEARGGVIYINRFDHLSHASRELVLQRVREMEAKRELGVLPRFLFGTARTLDNSIVRSITHSIPIVVSLPRLADRGVEERTQLVLHFLRVEGRRVAADASISRGALRALVNAEFKDNIDGLRSCITNCCASAYLNRKSDTLVIRTYNLPSDVISGNESHPDDDQLVQANRKANDPSQRVIALFQQIVDPVQSYHEGEIGFAALLANASAAIRAYGDYMNFEDQSSNPRIGSYEKLISPVIEEVNRAYGIELSRRIAHLVAQSIFMQLWGSVYLAKWKGGNTESLSQLLSALEQNLQDVCVIVNQIASKTKVALGVGLDDLSLILLFVEVEQTLKTSAGPRDCLGVIMCHGYSTATSIADAADRILRQHVFEAIDMTYEQDVSEVAGQLARLVARFSHCRSIAVLVDMGSLESVADAISDVVNCDIYVANNVSTALALEVGAALLAHEPLDAVLDRVSCELAPRHSVIRSSKGNEVVLFCSESGIEAADRIRALVQDSIPGDAGILFVTCDYADLCRCGEQSTTFISYRVRAIVGTMDPGIVSVPFVALEDILYQGCSDAIDRLLYPTLGPEGISKFHANLLRNLTLRNVVESITILNPEMLYLEADRAVKRLSELSGVQVDSRKRIAVYVHLCGLIERLVTKNFVDTYPDVDEFAAGNGDFIRWFREAFSDMSKRYRVEIPISEIAYVHHMLNMEPAERDSGVVADELVLEDE